MLFMLLVLLLQFFYNWYIKILFLIFKIYLTFNLVDYDFVY